MKAITSFSLLWFYAHYATTLHLQDRYQPAAHLLDLLQEASDEPCPEHPPPVDFGDELPSEIQTALGEVSDFLESLRQETLSPGSYASITYRGRTIYSQGFGQSDIETGDVPTAETGWRIGSVTKLFVVLATLQLRESGQIESLTDELSKYAPIFSVLDPFESDTSVTFHQIGTQLSGLPREFTCPTGFSLICNTTEEAAWQSVSETRLISPPYTRPSYSNLGFSIMGHIVGDFVYGTSFEDITEKEILEPLDMTKTGFFFTDEVTEYLAKGYVFNPQTGLYIEAPLYDIGWSRPAGQMYSTGNDMDKLAVALLSPEEKDDDFLQRTSRRELMLPQWMNPDADTFFGMPWEIQEQHSYLVRRKGGNIDGFSAGIALVPELELSLNIFWNFGVDSFAASDGVFDILLPVFTEYLSDNQPLPALPDDVDKYLGIYAVTGVPTATTEIILDDGILWLQKGGAFLEHFENDIFVMHIVPELITCNLERLTSQEGSYVFFQIDETTGDVLGLEIPGILQRFTKVDTQPV